MTADSNSRCWPELAGLAGGARRRITFFARAKKVIKESTPPAPPFGFQNCLPPFERLRNSPFGLKQCSPTSPESRQAIWWRRVDVTPPTYLSDPLCTPWTIGEAEIPFSRRRRFEVGPGKPKAGESCLNVASSFAARTHFQPPGFRRLWGVLYLVPFFARAKK